MGIRDGQIRRPSPRSTPWGRSTIPPVISRIAPSLVLISRRRHTVVSLRGRWWPWRVTIPRALMVISRTPVNVHTRGVSIIPRRRSRWGHGSRRQPRRRWRRVIAATPDDNAIRVSLHRSMWRVIVTRSTRSRSKIFSLPLNRRPRGISGDRHWAWTPGSDPRRIPRRVIRDTAVRTRRNWDRWLRVDCWWVQVPSRRITTFDLSGRIPLWRNLGSQRRSRVIPTIWTRRGRRRVS